MDGILSVTELKKRYSGFALNVSFSLRRGKITGFIGRNGAGKTTTLKSLLSLVHPDSGKIAFFGMDFPAHEREIKQKIGFVSGGFAYYPHKKLKRITEATKAFYPEWQEEKYAAYMKKFGLNEEKTPAQLSDGMKIKYALALALSHGAELLILDEPTSGIDPVSREELVDIFLSLAEEGKTIFFSTHITSDLDKCADDVLYLRNGKILAAGNLEEIVHRYRAVEFSQERFGTLSVSVKERLIGAKRSKNGYAALTAAADEGKIGEAGGRAAPADLETIMIHFDRADEAEENV